MRIVTAVLVCASAGLAAAHAADKLVGGPVVVNAGPRTATITWVVESGEVKLGAQPGELTAAAPILRCEKVTYANLKPGATYHYEVPGYAGAEGSFKTPPAGPADFQFVVYGDTRTRHNLHQRVVDAIVKTEPDFVVHTGDLVSDGNDTALWPIFFSIEKELLRKTVFFPSLGNHERNNPRYYEFFDVRTPYYSFNWGAAHFTILNSDIGNAALSAQARDAFWSEQRRWLEDDLRKAQGAALRFLAFHHPPFSAVRSRQNGNREIRALVPLFEQYKVTAVFSGHDHNYQHHLKDGVHYIVTGGGGAPLYDVAAPTPGLTLKVESVEHYVRVKVNGRQAHLEAVALDGHLIDTVDLHPAEQKTAPVR